MAWTEMTKAGDDSKYKGDADELETRGKCSR